jgi:integrase
MGRGPGVRASSETSIQIDFRYKGVRCRERLSLAPTPANLKYAKRLKATIEHEIATHTFDYGRHFPESRRGQLLRHSTGAPIRDALLAYVDSLGNELQPETVDEYRHDAEIVAAGLKGKTIATLKRADVREWISSLNLTKKRIDNLLIPLRGALNRAVEDEEIEGSPLAGFRVRRVEKQRETIDPFTPKEIEALARASLGQLWTAWAWTGLRSGEIIGLEWRDVDLARDRLHIRRAVRVGREKSPKTESGERSVHLLPAARQAFEIMAVGRASVAVFLNPNTGERWHEDRGLARAFRRDCNASGVRYRYPYQLRHTFATWALSSGENPAWAAKQMGHKDLMMFFKVYAKWMPVLDPTAGSKMTSAVKSKAA